MLNGSVKQFTSPDQLNLNPELAVIAVDSFGLDDLEVNGVTFLGDQDEDGEVTQDGVTVRTIAPNQIIDWAVPPTFTGADQDSADNLAEVMMSIRWNGAPNPVSIEVEGLTAGTTYEVQLLFNEGRDRDRVWDVTVLDELVVDNVSSNGNFPDDRYDFDTSAAFTTEFVAPNGTVNIEMAQDLGGEPAEGDDNNPILQGIVIHEVDTTDTDGDGMPDIYEEANGLDPETNDADLDKDGDGLSNLEEFEEGTDPDNEDTDDDGLSDGVENGGGTFVSAMMTGSNPRRKDSDDDGLDDGAEVNTHGSDPNKVDTDGDGFDDGFEIEFDGDPTDAAITPSLKVTTGIFEGGDADEGLDLDGVFVYAVNASSFGAAGQARDANFTSDEDTPGITIDAVNDIPQWGAEMDFGETTNDDVLERVMWGIRWTPRPSSVIITMENLVPGAHYKAQTLHAEKYCDRGWDVFLDDVLILDDFNAGRVQLGDPEIPGGNAGTENGAYVAIEFVASASTVTLELNGADAPFDDGNSILNGVTLERFVDENDADGDGIPTFWEDDFGLDPNDAADAALDPDGDGVSNLDEFKRGSKPNDDDSDDDGLKDNVETNTGTFVSNDDRGTNPSAKDSDADGLDDNVETNTGTFVSATDTGTSPLKKDTDEDGVDDAFEIELPGGNPVDPKITPDIGTVHTIGECKEFFGPDDLHLDPSAVVIAVDNFGDEDREVNGVLFQTDRTDVDSEGLAERDGVSVTTLAANFIDGWAQPPLFTGGQGDSADNLAAVMEDIRWNGAPNPITIDIEGLDPGAPYEVQLLVNEGPESASSVGHWNGHGS